MRLFLAINVPPALRSKIYREAERMRLAAPDVAWTRADLLHFTVKFLGELPPELVEPIAREVGKAVAARPAFPLTLAGAGAFPNFHRPRVVWIGVRDHRTVTALAEDVEQACELLGFAQEARSFSAHLTIGRVKRDLTPAAAAALERAANTVHNEYDVPVRSVDLMRSELGPGGPRYTVLHALPLGQRE